MDDLGWGPRFSTCVEGADNEKNSLNVVSVRLTCASLAAVSSISIKAKPLLLPVLKSRGMYTSMTLESVPEHDSLKFRYTVERSGVCKQGRFVDLLAVGGKDVVQLPAVGVKVDVSDVAVWPVRACIQVESETGGHWG